MEQQKRVRRRRKKGLKLVSGYLVIGAFIFVSSFAIIVSAFIGQLSKYAKIFMFILLLTAAATGIYYGYRWVDSMNVSNGLSQLVTETLENPAESSVDIDTYVVKPEAPRYISLPSIAAEGALQPVAGANGSIVSPSNVHVAGWYNGSVLPGQDGLSIINGHTRGKYSKGLFYELDKLKPGDTVSVTYGNGQVREFIVKEIKKVSIREAYDILYTRDQELNKQLNLIAVTNASEAGTLASNYRTIVVAGAQ